MEDHQATTASVSNTCNIQAFTYLGCDLCFFFTVHVSLLPALNLMKIIVVPILNDKYNDVSDKCNYRLISLSTIFAKVLVSLLNAWLGNVLLLRYAQFEFRLGLSTKSTVHGPVLYWALDAYLWFFPKFIQDVRPRVVRCYLGQTFIFRNWYLNQVNSVKRANKLRSIQVGVRGVARWDFVAQALQPVWEWSECQTCQIPSTWRQC